MLALQITLYCLLFLLLVKLAVRDSGIHCLYFYPKPYLEEAQRRGIAEKDAVMAQGKRFLIPFCVGMLAVLVGILAFWDRFKIAYWQAYLFLVVMNWFDGIVLDRLWVGHGRVWRVPGMEGVPYVKSWKTVLDKRSAATVLYLAIAPLPAAAAVFLGKF